MVANTLFLKTQEKSKWVNMVESTWSILSQARVEVLSFQALKKLRWLEFIKEVTKSEE